MTPRSVGTFRALTVESKSKPWFYFYHQNVTDTDFEKYSFIFPGQQQFETRHRK